MGLLGRNLMFQGNRGVVCVSANVCAIWGEAREMIQRPTGGMEGVIHDKGERAGAVDQGKNRLLRMRG